MPKLRLVRSTFASANSKNCSTHVRPTAAPSWMPRTTSPTGSRRRWPALIRKMQRLLELSPAHAVVIERLVDAVLADLEKCC